MDFKTYLISFSIGWMFWYLSEHFADYNDYPSYNLVLGVFCLLMIFITMKKFNMDYISSMAGFISGQHCYLMYDYIHNSEDSVLTSTTIYSGLISVGLFVALVSTIINKL
jgi:hypothetical protein